MLLHILGSIFTSFAWLVITICILAVVLTCIVHPPAGQRLMALLQGITDLIREMTRLLTVWRTRPLYTEEQTTQERDFVQPQHPSQDYPANKQQQPEVHKQQYPYDAGYQPVQSRPSIPIGHSTEDRNEQNYEAERYHSPHRRHRGQQTNRPDRPGYTTAQAVRHRRQEPPTE